MGNPQFFVEEFWEDEYLFRINFEISLPDAVKSLEFASAITLHRVFKVLSVLDVLCTVEYIHPKPIRLGTEGITSPIEFPTIAFPNA